LEQVDLFLQGVGHLMKGVPFHKIYVIAKKTFDIALQISGGRCLAVTFGVELWRFLG
jgi:hypothetical protein